jgi:sigma-B regulation protein RsbU (phosphoserine phosphatase)
VVCSAGHNPAFVYGVDGLRRLEADGMPVGLFDFASYVSTTLTLKPGDTIVMYSDGVTEAHSVDGAEFGEDRLVDVLKKHHGESAGDVLKHVVDAVQAFAKGAEQYDDVTALVVRYLGPRGGGGA